MEWENKMNTKTTKGEELKQIQSSKSEFQAAVHVWQADGRRPEKKIMHKIWDVQDAEGAKTWVSSTVKSESAL